MKIGYLILNYKDAKRSVAAARMAAGLDAVKEVLIVDNCSPDDSWGLLQYAAGGKISVLRTEENGGYSYGNNIGVRSLSEKGCDIIAVANPDVSIAEENLLLLANALSDPVYAAVSGVEYDAAGQLTQPVLWRLKSYGEDVLTCFPMIYRTVRRLKKQTPVPELTGALQQAELLKGSFLVCSAERFLKAGGFDENVFLYCEERILAKRMEQAGFRLGLMPAAKYVHDHASSVEREYRSSADRMKLLYRSVLYYQDTYGSIGKLRHLFLSLCMKWSVFEFRIIDLIRTCGKSDGGGKRC